MIAVLENLHIPWKKITSKSRIVTVSFTYESSRLRVCPEPVVRTATVVLQQCPKNYKQPGSAPIGPWPSRQVGQLGHQAHLRPVYVSITLLVDSYSNDPNTGSPTET